MKIVTISQATVYMPGGKEIRGRVVAEDDDFFTLERRNGKIIRVSKKGSGYSIISFPTVEGP